MALSKQITACEIWIYQSDGTTPVSTYPRRVDLYSGSITFNPYFLGGSSYNEALSGKLITQLGGYRATIQLGWERLISTSNLSNIVENAKITSYRPRIVFAPDASSNTSNFNVIITDVAWSAAIESTITSQPISVTLMSQEYFSNIPPYLLQ